MGMNLDVGGAGPFGCMALCGRLYVGASRHWPLQHGQELSVGGRWIMLSKGLVVHTCWHHA